MAKTGKELAVEIAQAYIESWHSVQGRTGMTYESIQILIQTAYDAIHNTGVTARYHFVCRQLALVSFLSLW